jgi:L-lactate utilization protein LutC
LLIDEISEAALAAIEQAASEAARAAMLAGLDREAAAVREASLKQAEVLRWQLEAEQQKQEVKDTKKAGIKNAIKAGVICLLSGLAVGTVGTLIIGRK